MKRATYVRHSAESMVQAQAWLRQRTAKEPHQVTIYDDFVRVSVVEPPTIYVVKHPHGGMAPAAILEAWGPRKVARWDRRGRPQEDVVAEFREWLRTRAWMTR